MRTPNASWTFASSRASNLAKRREKRALFWSSQQNCKKLERRLVRFPPQPLLTGVAHVLRQDMHLHFSPAEQPGALASLKGAAQRYMK
jgi:hypothetical protein